MVERTEAAEIVVVVVVVADKCFCHSPSCRNSCSIGLLVATAGTLILNITTKHFQMLALHD